MIYIGNDSADTLADVNKIYLGLDLVYHRLKTNEFELSFYYDASYAYNYQEFLINDIRYRESGSPVNINLNTKYGVTNITKIKFGINTIEEGEGWRFANAYTEITKMPDTSNIIIMSSMFADCMLLTSIPQIDTSNAKYMLSMFSDCESLVSIPQIDTSKVICMDHMFAGCKSLVSTPIINLSSCEDISYMFSGCRVLNTITFAGRPNPLIKTQGAFGDPFGSIDQLHSLAPNGTLYYDARYKKEYERIFTELLRFHSDWKIIAK